MSETSTSFNLINSRALINLLEAKGIISKGDELREIKRLGNNQLSLLGQHGGPKWRKGSYYPCLVC